MLYALALLSGILFWTFVEYWLHRMLGHEIKLRNKFRKEHQRHHHKKNYFASNWDKFLSSLVFGLLTFAIVYLLSSLVMAIIFTIGFVGMYLVYEYIHKSLHVKPPRTEYGRYIRKHHFYHHFGNEFTNHGVTSPLWDIIFRTHIVPVRVEVRKRFSMDWLLCVDQDQIKEEFRIDYHLKS